MTLHQIDRVAHHDLEIFVGSDGIVRINVDGHCALRVRVALEHIRLTSPGATAYGLTPSPSS